MVWALSKLNYHPGDAWMNKFIEVTVPRLGEFSPIDLVKLVQSLGPLNVVTTAPWMEAYSAAAAAKVGGVVVVLVHRTVIKVVGCVIRAREQW